MKHALRSAGAALLVSLLVGLGQGQVTARVSVASDGTQGNGESQSQSTVSADGRYVAFGSQSSNLVSGDTNGASDVFVRDLLAGTTERVSVASDGSQGQGFSSHPSITPDGRYVAFYSNAINLVPGDTNARQDVFVRDLAAGTTERVSLATDGTQGNDHSSFPAISADGRYVAFKSRASNLVPGDTNGFDDMFVRDRVAGTTERVSVSTNGTQANWHSNGVAISADGRYVGFRTLATNLVPGDTNGVEDMFVRDRLAGTTERVSVASDGTQANAMSNFTPSISADGRYVAFTSSASNLAPGDTNGYRDIFVRDRVAGTTERVSLASDGTQADGSSGDPWISADGRYVAFSNTAGLVPEDTNGAIDIFVRDRVAGMTERVSVASDGAQGDGASLESSISEGGRYVTFWSHATNLVPGDTNGVRDMFLRDRGAALLPPSPFCFGDGSGTPCPCGNAGDPDHGCRNGSFLSGAALSASGNASVSADSLVLAAASSVPGAAGLFFQGDNAPNGGSGVQFGDGLRCAGGIVVRLEVRFADGGGSASTTLAIGAAGSVSTGGVKRYQWWYRDPTGSPCLTGFNLSNGLEVTWGP